MTTEKSMYRWRAGDVAMIKQGYEFSGMELDVIGEAILLNQWWVPVIDTEDGDPTFYKEHALIRMERGDK